MSWRIIFRSQKSDLCSLRKSGKKTLDSWVTENCKPFFGELTLCLWLVTRDLMASALGGLNPGSSLICAAHAPATPILASTLGTNSRVDHFNSLTTVIMGNTGKWSALAFLVLGWVLPKKGNRTMLFTIFYKTSVLRQFRMLELRRTGRFHWWFHIPTTERGHRPLVRHWRWTLPGWWSAGKRTTVHPG